MQEKEFLTDIDLPENFQGVWIPRLIWKSKDLNWIEKCLMTEIDWLSKEAIGKGKKGCWASNDYLAKIFNVHKNTISRMISKFVKMGWIEIVSFNGRYRILVSTLDTRPKKRD